MSVFTRWVASLVAVAIIVAAAMIDAARTGAVGTALLLAVAELVVFGMLASFRGAAPIVVRSDLSRWLEHTSAAAGESKSALVDRAVSAYRAASSDDADV